MGEYWCGKSLPKALVLFKFGNFSNVLINRTFLSKIAQEFLESDKNFLISSFGLDSAQRMLNILVEKFLLLAPIMRELLHLKLKLLMTLTPGISRLKSKSGHLFSSIYGSNLIVLAVFMNSAFSSSSKSNVLIFSLLFALFLDLDFLPFLGMLLELILNSSMYFSRDLFFLYLLELQKSISFNISLPVELLLSYFGLLPSSKLV